MTAQAHDLPNLPKAFHRFTIANGHDLSVEDAGDALAYCAPSVPGVRLTSVPLRSCDPE